MVLHSLMPSTSLGPLFGPGGHQACGVGLFSRSSDARRCRPRPQPPAVSTSIIQGLMFRFTPVSREDEPCEPHEWVTVSKCTT